MQLASQEDAPEIAALVLSISKWLLSKGIHQWADPNPEPLIRKEISEGKIYVLREGSQIAGTLTLVENADPMWPHPQGAIYLHRLAVPREQAGTGKSLIQWAETEARRRGFTKLRLDCHRENTVLRNYYEGLGYKFQEEIFHPPFNMHFALFGKELR